MKHFIYIILFVCIFCFIETPACAIKIGLLEHVKETNIAVSKPGAIYDYTSGREIYTLSPMKSYKLKNGRKSIQININGKFYNLNSRNIRIKTFDKNGFVLAKQRWYRDDLQIFKASDGLTVINELDLELYLLGVVPAEMPSSWNIEAHKAQAIAARSYAIANLGKRMSRGYNLKDTPEDQAYGGAMSESKRTNKAVFDTRGQVLVYNNKVISAYYHASAGGHTVVSGKVWCKNLPYIHAVPSFDSTIPKKGHGVGMSQYGANNLANHGYNAYQILAYYYTNVKLATISINY